MALNINGIIQTLAESFAAQSKKTNQVLALLIKRAELSDEEKAKVETICKEADESMEECKRQLDAMMNE